MKDKTYFVINNLTLIERLISIFLSIKYLTTYIFFHVILLICSRFDFNAISYSYRCENINQNELIPLSNYFFKSFSVKYN